MKTILVKNLTKMAMTESDGLKLRSEIEQIMKEEESKIVIDFTGISLFATMFFNASIGHFVLNLSPEKCEKIFEVINITDLGKETFNHSFDNAKTIYENKVREEDIGNITQNNIEHA